MIRSDGVYTAVMPHYLRKHDTTKLQIIDHENNQTWNTYITIWRSRAKILPDAIWC